MSQADTLRAALARITALRAAQPEISTPPAGLNPLDLNLLDPLTPGRFPGIGTPGGPAGARSPSKGSLRGPFDKLREHRGRYAP